MRRTCIMHVIQFALGWYLVAPAAAVPPYSGTIFLDPDIITASDPTAFTGLAPNGQAPRTMYDRRPAAFIILNPYLFNASFDDGLVSEIQVNPEFGSIAAAQAEALKYATVIGRLPTALRSRMKTMWIHMGVQPFGGGNDNVLIHVGQAALYEADGILEETLVHEAAHTSLDPAYASSSGWRAAQAADGEFISTYARDFPNSEDIAESYLPYFAIRHRAARLSPAMVDTIRRTMPNRIRFFDSLGLDLHPVETCAGSNCMVEYLNTSDFPGSPGGHFFYTAEPAEQAAIDSGAAGQFQRTGRKFRTGGPAPVCRFYGSVTPGPNSHFFTVDVDECNALKAAQIHPTPANVQQWNYEGLSFNTSAPGIGAGGTRTCPADTLPIFRAYNNAFPLSGPKNPWDSNHRFSPVRADASGMTNSGWRDEGIVFCATP